LHERETEGKMKKIEASMIKRLVRTYFISLVLELSSIISYSCTHKAFLEHSSIEERKEKEGQGKQWKSKEGWIKQLQQEDFASNMLHV